MAVPVGPWGQELLAQDSSDPIRQMQRNAIRSKQATWGRWGTDKEKYSSWTSHSNRLIPVYTFGLTLETVKGANSVYRDKSRLKKLYGRTPEHTFNPSAEYFDQTDICRLQELAVAQGKKFIILIVFDGMDWQTSHAAAVYRSAQLVPNEDRGFGLLFQDYNIVATDFGSMVTSPHNGSTKVDVNAQMVTAPPDNLFGGYNAEVGGRWPWDGAARAMYLTGRDPSFKHAITDSASSATSMTSGIKTFNGAINVDVDGAQVIPIARKLQAQSFKVGVVTSVPISHATPASAYANNVSRYDYQDLTRDLLGLPSVSHRARPLKGVDVLIGCGWGVSKQADGDQGHNFSPGNQFLSHTDFDQVDVDLEGRYVVACRRPGANGSQVLEKAAARAEQEGHRLFGFFGTSHGHLPYQTANGDFSPTRGITSRERYSPNDLFENPTLAEMTSAALRVLDDSDRGFWLMIEPGDVDWANHNNNIDDAIGAVLSGDAAFRAVTQWAEDHNCWDETVVIVTADHGHLFIMDNPSAFAGLPMPKQ